MAATTADLTGYTPAARWAIESEASTWLHGDVEGARQMYDRQREWARGLTPSQREYQAWGMWHANRLLELAAIREIDQEAAGARP